MKRRTTRVYASLSKLRVRTSNKIQNEEDNALEYTGNSMESIIPHNNTSDCIINTEDATSRGEHNNETSHVNTFEDGLIIEEDESSLDDSYTQSEIWENEVSLYTL
jgi:hypothetical protein